MTIFIDQQKDAFDMKVILSFNSKDAHTSKAQMLPSNAPAYQK